MTSVRESALADIVGSLKTTFTGAEVSEPSREAKVDSINVKNIRLTAEEVADKIIQMLDSSKVLGFESPANESAGTDLWTMGAVMLHTPESSERAIVTVTYLQENAHLRMSLQWTGLV